MGSCAAQPLAHGLHPSGPARPPACRPLPALITAVTIPPGFPHPQAEAVEHLGLPRTAELAGSLGARFVAAVGDELPDAYSPALMAALSAPTAELLTQV